MNIGSKIVATGSFVPKNRVSNEELESELQLERGWIEKRTGVKTRAIAGENQAVSDIAKFAGENAIAHFAAQDFPPIGTLILATSTPDHLLPPTAPKLAKQLGLPSVAAFDLTVACSGFLYGLILADSIVKTRRESVVLVAANILSRRCRNNDYSTRAIFADGAGATVISPSTEESRILSTYWNSDGSGYDQLLIPDGGSKSPFGPDSYDKGRHLMQINEGGSIFRYAVESMADSANKVLAQSGMSADKIDWWIPHQANRRIIHSTARILKIPAAKTLTTIGQLGNSSAATIPVTLDWYLKQENSIIRSGDRVLFTAAAAGNTSAAVLLQI